MEAASTTSTMVSSDPVSSLRAAALSTLKSKRRKAAVEAPVPVSLRPPPSTESFQLDYGQEDTSGGAPKSNNIPSTPDVPERREKEKTSIPTEDTQMREEGEISEEEEPSPPAPSSNDHKRNLSEVPPNKPKSATPEVKMHVEATSTVPPSLQSSRSTSPEVQLPPQTQSLALVDRLSDPVSHIHELPQEVDSEMFDINFEEPSQFGLGHDRVRPGLELTQEEFDTVKDIILDLLGWGVPFDYLVECGISKELIYYVFNELELHLPDSFDSSGIVPYTPETFPQMHQSTLMPPPPLPEKPRHDSVDSDASVKMEAPENVIIFPPSIKVDPLPSVENTRSADLHDMERRRRQELLARKAAVQASRKQVHSTSFELPAEAPLLKESMDIDKERQETPPYAATETVEDFLNSLGTTPVPVDGAPQIMDRNARDVEVSQRGQPTSRRILELDEHERREAPLTPATSDRFQAPFARSPPFTETPPSSANEPPPSSVASSSSNLSQISTLGSDSNPRRGVKRPVASDFVDFDPTPKRHEPNSRMERLNGAGGITRRLNSRTSFHNINSRRCVIDLSDSEDDEDEQHPEDPAQPRRDRRAPSTAFSHPVSIKQSPSGTMSPAALEQKELEIRKMRELIAQREEETRLRKLALARSASASYAQTRTVSTPVSRDQVPKVEENDTVVLSSTDPGQTNTQAYRDLRRSESATPPPSRDPIESDEAPTPENQDMATNSLEPQAAMGIIDNLGQDTPKGSVDADQIMSPSAQMKLRTPTPPVHQKPDEKRPEDFPPLNHDDLLQEKTFSSYRSPFDVYPLLRSHGQPVSSTSHFLSSEPLTHTYSSSQSPLPSDPLSVVTKHSTSHSFSQSSPSSSLPNLKPLILATAAKLLDPFKRLCRYEIPGGGTCRDEGCEDIHLSRLEGANQMGTIEPKDEDTAVYLFDTLPDLWRQQQHVFSPSTILSALQDVHHRNLNNPLRFEDRVSRALDSLGSPPTT